MGRGPVWSQYQGLDKVRLRVEPLNSSLRRLHLTLGAPGAQTALTGATNKETGRGLEEEKEAAVRMIRRELPS